MLKNYVSYAAYYKLGSQADQKLVPAGKAKKSLARFASLHETAIAQKVVVIVEHFRTHVIPKIGGKAKAMVVTSGRVAAVRYKLAMDRYLTSCCKISGSSRPCRGYSPGWCTGPFRTRARADACG